MSGDSANSGEGYSRALTSEIREEYFQRKGKAFIICWNDSTRILHVTNSTILFVQLLACLHFAFVHEYSNVS